MSYGVGSCIYSCLGINNARTYIYTQNKILLLSLVCLFASFFLSIFLYLHFFTTPIPTLHFIFFGCKREKRHILFCLSKGILPNIRLLQSLQEALSAYWTTWYVLDLSFKLKFYQYQQCLTVQLCGRRFIKIKIDQFRTIFNFVVFISIFFFYLSTRY